MNLAGEREGKRQLSNHKCRRQMTVETITKAGDDNVNWIHLPLDSTQEFAFVKNKN